MLPGQREGRTAWPQGGLVASCVGPQEESQSTDQMPVHESPDVDHVGPHFLSQNSSLCLHLSFPASHALQGRRLVFHVWLEMNPYFRTLGVSLRSNYPDMETAGVG